MNTKEIKALPYRTLWNLPTPKGMKTGSEYVNEYGYTMDHNNITGLEKTGEVNQYEKIQLHADETKIEYILAKAAVDPTILNQRKGIFADISEMPQSMAEYKNLEIKIINQWNNLDLETRKQFDNSVDKFIAEFGTEEWSKKMGLETIQEVKEVIENIEEVKPIDNQREGEKVDE